MKGLKNIKLLLLLCPPQHALDLQLAVANILQLLVNSERNQQVLCEACLHQRLLQRCSQALGDEDHPLHPPLQRMFERLASQALQPMALRYWALSPAMCRLSQCDVINTDAHS